MERESTWEWPLVTWSWLMEAFWHCNASKVGASKINLTHPFDVSFLFVQLFIVLIFRRPPSQWRYRGLQWQNRRQSSDLSGIRPGPTRTPIRENWPSSVRKSYWKRFLGGKSQTNKPCRTSCRRLDLGSAIERLRTCIFAQWVPHAGQMETRPQLVPRESHLRLMS